MKTEGRKFLLKNIQDILSQAGTIEERLKKTCQVLRKRSSRYDWIGIYLVEGEMLVLKTYDGPFETEHTRIRIGDGICGFAAETGRTEIVGDVSEDLRFIACFPSTRSEIVVPIKDGDDDEVLGEIDVDSDQPEAFSEEDKELLESVASLISMVLSDETTS
jgi:GAF domain-containing protein